jgi:alkylated DNA repair protein alkB family protein 8
LSEECHGKGYEALICNCLELPFLSEIVDYCVCIAVIHHLSTRLRRVHAIEEIARVLRVGGEALIYVWAKNQKQNEDLSSYLKQRKRKKKIADDNVPDSRTHSIRFPSCPENEVSLPVHVNRTQFKHEDMLVPWKLNQNTAVEGDTGRQTFLRYYHIFEEEELETMCRSVKGIEIIESYYDQGNWCVKFRKMLRTW